MSLSCEYLENPPLRKDFWRAVCSDLATSSDTRWSWIRLVGHHSCQLPTGHLLRGHWSTENNTFTVNSYNKNSNFHPLEVVSRYRDPQLQVGENYSHLLNLGPNICKSWCLNTHFVPVNCGLTLWLPGRGACQDPDILVYEFYFSSFEAGIANAISIFKWRKIHKCSIYLTKICVILWLRSLTNDDGNFRHVW